MAVVTALAAVSHQGDPDVRVLFILASLLGGTGLALTGLLLLGLRPGHPLGAVLTVTGVALVLEFALRELAYADRTAAWAPTAVWLSLLADVVWFPLGLVLLLLLFPDGRPTSPGWAWAVRFALVLAAVRVLLRAGADGPLVAESHGLELPWSGPLPGAAVDVRGLLDLVAILMVPLAVASLVVRYRRADAGGRQRLKPLGAAALVIASGLLVQQVPGLAAVGITVFVVGVTVALPAALAVGALRYRVWDLDPVLVATLVYGALAVLVTATYVAVVVLVSEAVGRRVATPDLLPSVAATAVVAVLFGPAKSRLEGLARRLVYGVRATPYSALAALPRHLVEAPATEDVLPRTAEALARGLGVPAARVRTRLEDGTHLESWFPPTGPPDDEPVVVVVRHGGEAAGDVAVVPSADRPLGGADLRLLEDLAAQAGPALRAVALDASLRDRIEQVAAQAEELRDSRRRIVTAQVLERRRLERDIHDGAQQQLVALSVLLAQADDLMSSDPAAARAELTRARTSVSASIDGLRDLARGIYPPVLTARGLTAAIRAQVRDLDVDVDVQSTAALAEHRPGPAAEVAAYFCCLEALQNTAKHAPGAQVSVRLDRTTDTLTFEVEDDGPGFLVDARGPAEGSGLVGMADRAGAAGGELVVTSQVGQGTVVRGWVPAL